MNKLINLRVLHLTYLAFLVAFIYFYYSTYQPLKLHRICAGISSQKTLDANPVAAYEFYQDSYKKCISEKSLNLFALLKDH